MGWAGGSAVMGDIIKVARAHVEEEERKAFFIKMVKILEDQDWDTHDEVIGEDKHLDQAIYALHADWWEEDRT